MSEVPENIVVLYDSEREIIKKHIEKPAASSALKDMKQFIKEKE